MPRSKQQYDLVIAANRLPVDQVVGDEILEIELPDLAFDARAKLVTATERIGRRQARLP